MCVCACACEHVHVYVCAAERVVYVGHLPISIFQAAAKAREVASVETV